MLCRTTADYCLLDPRQIISFHALNTMGMFNHIFIDLKCPITDKIARNCEIQIKWQEHSSRLLNSYKIGDYLEELLLEYNNAWIRAGYICSQCSNKSQSKFGDYIKTEDQKWHFAFVKIKDCKIEDILSESDFIDKDIAEFKIYD